MRVGRAFVRSTIGRLLLVLVVIYLVFESDNLFPPAAARVGSKAMRRQGAVLFHEKGCEHCHGVDGIGTERAPSLSGVGRTLRKPEIARQVHDGGKQMPAFGNTLANDEIQQLVEYLSAKKKRLRKTAIEASVLNSKN